MCNFGCACYGCSHGSCCSHTLSHCGPGHPTCCGTTCGTCASCCLPSACPGGCSTCCQRPCTASQHEYYHNMENYHRSFSNIRLKNFLSLKNLQVTIRVLQGAGCSCKGSHVLTMSFRNLLIYALFHLVIKPILLTNLEEEKIYNVVNLKRACGRLLPLQRK